MIDGDASIGGEAMMEGDATTAGEPMAGVGAAEGMRLAVRRKSLFVGVLPVPLILTLCLLTSPPMVEASPAYDEVVATSSAARCSFRDDCGVLCKGGLDASFAGVRAAREPRLLPCGFDGVVFCGVALLFALALLSLLGVEFELRV
mmetsp:Transcript_25258/g.63359  ORF Transcript_25258/g.63359 Transcript_25258/m.63359 type:complete len:146 (-) Transcript_25258:122-559(-)